MEYIQFNSYLLISSYVLKHVVHALSTPLCFAFSPSNDFSPNLYHLLAALYRCILVRLVSYLQEHFQMHG